MADDRTISRVGTARALVLLAAALAVGGTALLCLLAVLLVDRIALATAAMFASVLVSAVIGTVAAARGRSVRGVVGFGCGTLLVGVVLGLAVMLVLISVTAGNPA